jgi:CHAT domain-containing protein
MQPRRIGIPALITLLAAAATPLAPNVLLLFSTSPVLAQTSANRKAEADRLFQQGFEQYNTNQFQSSLQSWQQALAIYKETGNRQLEAKSLNNLGNTYYSLGQYPQAIKSYEQSLAIAQDIRDRQVEANSLWGLGWAYIPLGQYQQAIKFYQQSLAVTREIHDLPYGDRFASRQGEAIALEGLGIAYRKLGQYQQSIEFYQQSLTIRRDIRDRVGEANSLEGLGSTVYLLGQYQQSIEFYQQQLAVARAISARRGEANALGGLGNAYYALGRYEEAIRFYQLWLTTARELFDRRGEGIALGNLGNAYQALKQFQPAIEFYQQQLTIAQDIGDRAGEGATLSNIGKLLAQQNQPELAIIFYKQSVNVRESIRRDIRGLSREQQQSYTQTIADTYRSLADLLLKQDRVLEAQRVLDLLKVQELEDYLRHVRGSDDTAQGVAERSPEQQIKKGYEAILNKAIQLGKELIKLESIPQPNRTEVERSRVIELRRIEQEITQQFAEFLKSSEVMALVAQLRQTTGGQNFDLGNNATSLQDNLKRLQQDAVILYPFVLVDRLELVLVTPYAPPIRRTVAVNRDELNQAIIEFRSALKNPSTNAKVPAQKLYNWLIKPIENDLAQAEAKTIIYAPDGQLRYIPLAALYDGKQWLVQKFRINNITAISLTDFNTKPQSKLQVFAGAFTQGSYSFQIGGQQFAFRGLEYAGVEVENLARTVPGTTKVLDQQFNRETVMQMNDYSVVHLATHAAFVVGQPEESFILFGNGDRATLRDIERWRLPNVDLMVLSACETGLGDKLGDGKEILGFGYQMQRTGARSAIASLWSVDDGGTQALMNAFYGTLEIGNTTKAEALRQAQIALITDDVKAIGQQRGLIVARPRNNQSPEVVTNRLSHPYYWASFILIGNGL